MESDHGSTATAALDCTDPAIAGRRTRVKILIILFVLLIIASLASALFYLVTDRGRSRRMVKALALRVGLSIILFLFVMAGHYFGVLPSRNS
jgi:hypothetical protein